MSCRGCHERIQAHLDDPARAAEGDAELEQHVRACPACAALYRAARRLNDGLRLLASPLPPPDLAERIIFAVQADRARRRRLRFVAAAAVLAAGLLVALGLRMFRPTSPTPPPSAPGQNLVQKGQKPAPPIPAPRTPEPDVKIGDAVADATRREANETVRATQEVLPAVVAPVLNDLDLSTALGPAQPLREAGSGVSTGLEPITNSARRAVDMFLRELPPVGEANSGS
jgi:anti-sigma factor RsiW